MREIKSKTFGFGKEQKEKSLENVEFSRLFGGGGCEIRTHVSKGQTVFKPCRVLPESSLIVTKLLEFYLKKPIFTDTF